MPLMSIGTVGSLLSTDMEFLIAPCLVVVLCLACHYYWRSYPVYGEFLHPPCYQTVCLRFVRTDDHPEGTCHSPLEVTFFPFSPDKRKFHYLQRANPRPPGQSNGSGCFCDQQHVAFGYKGKSTRV